jgi:hypothetical protein
MLHTLHENSKSPEALEDLDRYPAEPEVHAYLLDRLTRVADSE